MEEYISHVDYKKMMENFKKGTPKRLLKEGWNFDEEGEGHSLWIEKELEDLHLAGNIDTQTLNKALDYVSDNDYELYADNLDANYVLKQVAGVEEGNAFTAGLAKAKKGQKFKVGGETVKDTSNYNAPMEESGHGDEPFDFNKSAIESASGDKISHTEEDDYGRPIYWSTMNPNVTYYIGNNEQIIKYNGETGERFPIGDLRHYDEPTHDYEPDTDADYEEPRDDFGMAGDFNDGEFWEAEVKKLQEIAGVGPQDDGPEDDDEEEREKRAKKAEMDDEEAENAEKEIDEEESKVNMHDPDAAAKVVAQKYGAQLKPELAVYKKSHNDYIQAIRQYDNKDPKFREITAAHNKLVKNFQNNAINLAGEEMLASGMSKVEVRNLLSGYGYFEDWLPDYISTLHKELGDVAEGLHMPPLQATGQTIMTNEDQASYGFSVLSPEDRKQLREYINHYKTIKSEISKLLEKAGKSGKIMEGTKEEDERVPAARPAHYNEPTKTPKHKSSNLGGNRTGLVMTKAEMWEGEETAHERMDGLVDRKLHDAFQKVTGMIMKELMDDGFDEGDIKNFLQYEIDKKAKEAINAQHDF